MWDAPGCGRYPGAASAAGTRRLGWRVPGAEQAMSFTTSIAAARLEEILDAVPHKILMVRPDGTALYYNRAIQAYAGAPIALDRASRDRQLIHPNDLARLAAVRSAAVAEGRDFGLEVRVGRRDGAWRWHRLEVCRLERSDRLEAWVVTATDVDDLRKAARDAVEAGEDLRLAAAAAQLGIYRFDVETREHVWSAELKRIFALPADAPVPAEIGPLIHEDDRERVRAVIARSFDPAGDGLFHDEHRILRSDGSAGWVLVKGRVSFAGSGAGRAPRRGVGFVLDITERKAAETALAASEERYRSLVDSASDIIATLDLDGRVTSINPAVERILGYRPEEMIGCPLAQFVPADTIPMQQAMLERKLAGEPSTQYELELMAKDGVRRIVLDVKSRLVFGGTGEPLAIHSIARDITERKEAEARQSLLVRELQHRTKNMLAVIQSIATSTLRRSLDLDSALDTLIGRLHALANAQEFVAAGPGGGVPLRQLVEAGLGGLVPRAAITGDELVVGAPFAQQFALLVHELASNALRHGALSRPRGCVAVEWRVEANGAEPQLRFSWVERGGPAAHDPQERGFGTLLMASMGQTELAFAEEGFAYALAVPLADAVRGSA
jgi:PAS domain S-box-containing protein